MDVQFKFNIGDVVTHKSMVPPYSPTPEGKFGDIKPQMFTVMGRIADECPGGVQKHYRVRATAMGRWSESALTINLIQLHEEELVPLPMGPTSTL